MIKNQTKFANTTLEQWKRIFLVAIVMFTFMSFAAATGIMPVLAGNVNTTALNGVMKIVVDIIGKAALYIGVIITLWGVFQIILAFRREDSEGISKQITTVIVGGVLAGFGGFAPSLAKALGLTIQ